MNYELNELVKLKDDYEKLDKEEVKAELQELYIMYYPETLSKMTGISKKVIDSYKYGFRKPSFGNYLVLLELMSTLKQK